MPDKSKTNNPKSLKKTSRSSPKPKGDSYTIIRLTPSDEKQAAEMLDRTFSEVGVTAIEFPQD